MRFDLGRALGRPDADDTPAPASVDLDRALRGGYGPLIRQLAADLARERAAHQETRRELRSTAQDRDTAHALRAEQEERANALETMCSVEYADGREPVEVRSGGAAVGHARQVAFTEGVDVRVWRGTSLLWDATSKGGAGGQYPALGVRFVDPPTRARTMVSNA